MSKAVVTGCNGFIAKHLIKRLEKDGYLVKGTSREDSKEIEAILIKESPSVIYHLGAELKDDMKMFESNVCLTVRLLEYCRKTGCRFIYIGSSSEYGRKRAPIQESDSLEPMTMYEGTKGAASLMARSYANTFKFPVTILRPFSVYGPGEKDHRFLQVLLRKPSTIRVSKGMHDYVYITDFVEACVRLPFKQKGVFDILNIGTGVQTSNFDVVKRMEEVMGDHTFEIVECEGKVYDSNMWVCDTTYVREKYEFSCKVSLKEGLHQLLKEYNGENC